MPRESPSESSSPRRFGSGAGAAAYRCADRGEARRRAVINALASVRLGLDLARKRLVKTREDGGGSAWALAEFDRQLKERHSNARIGLVIDRDQSTNDSWPAVQRRLARLGIDIKAPDPEGSIAPGCGVWMWPDNQAHGDLEDFVTALVGDSPLLGYAKEVSDVAKSTHGAEYEAPHGRKAALKVRSIWRDASAAGGYGHLLRRLSIAETPAAARFLRWFGRLFLDDLPGA